MTPIVPVGVNAPGMGMPDRVAIPTYECCYRCFTARHETCEVGDCECPCRIDSSQPQEAPNFNRCGHCGAAFTNARSAHWTGKTLDAPGRYTCRISSTDPHTTGPLSKGEVGSGPVTIASAKAQLEAAGYVVLKAKSYRASQERQRLALTRADWAERDQAENRAWLERDVFPWERHLVQRLQHIAALAGSLGATAEQMVGPPCTCGMASCAEPVTP